MVVLIAEDEQGLRESLHQLLKDAYEVILCADGEEALKVLEKTSVDLVITDNQMPRVSGLELIRRGKAVSPSTAFLLMTGHASIEDAVKAIQLGADDYFTKPFETSEIRHRIAQIENLRSWKASIALKGSSKNNSHQLIGVSASVQRAKQFIDKAASVPSPVLLLGPSGSGKEIVANAIHEAGPRAIRPFVAINCASLSEQLMESELFGHEKGAFTGANAVKLGKFELAQGGTLFLDEVGELSPSLQAKLLRVLQEREFFRLGGVRVIKSDARVIAATHRPLKEMVNEGTFREDLFFRLNVLTFELPPLKDRKEDILPLVRFFWEQLTQEFGKRVTLSETLLQKMTSYSYPGNVRELRNVLERLLVFGVDKGTVGPEALPPEFHGMASVSSLHAPQGETGTRPSVTEAKGRGLVDQVEEFEYELIAEAMRATKGNQVRAAALLKITRTTLQYKLKKYGYPRETGSDLKKAA